MAYTETIKKATNAIALETKNGQGLCGCVINYGTKKAEEYKRAAANVDGYCLDDVYTTGGSDYKKQAEHFITNNMQLLGGHSYRITGHNSMQFSAAWYVEAKNADEAGDDFQEWLIYETKNGTKCIPLEHDDRPHGRRSRRYVYTTIEHTDAEEQAEERRYFFEEDERNMSGDIWGEIAADYLASVFPL